MPARVRRLPDDLGPLVPFDEFPFDDAPGMPVPGEIIELTDMVYLYIPDDFDRDDDQDPNVIPPSDEDLEIIAAYGRARAAVRDQNAQFPVPVEPSEAVKDAYADGGERVSRDNFAQRNADDTYVGYPFGTPDIYRPYLLLEPRSDTEATIWDCPFIGSILLNADGSLFFDTDEPYENLGTEAKLVKVEGRWVVDQSVTKEAACR